jgi:hypothetical protein
MLLLFVVVEWVLHDCEELNASRQRLKTMTIAEILICLVLFPVMVRLFVWWRRRQQRLAIGGKTAVAFFHPYWSERTSDVALTLR